MEQGLFDTLPSLGPKGEKKGRIRKIFGAIVIIVLSLSAVLLISIIAFLKSFDPDQYRDEIALLLGQNIKKKVEIGRMVLDYELLKGVNVKLKDIKIFDLMGSDGLPILGIKELSAVIDIKTLVWEREILITDIMALSPELLIFVNPSGQMDLSVFQPLPQEPSSAGGLRMPRGSSSLPGAPLKIEIRDIKILDGVLRVFLDRPGQQELFDVGGINVQLQNFSFREAFPFEARAAVMTERENMSINGKMVLDVVKSSVVLRDARLRFDTAMISPSRLQSLWPGVHDVFEKDKSFNGNLDFFIDNLVVDADGIAAIKGEGEFSEGQFLLKFSRDPLSDVSVKFGIQADLLELREIFARSGEGILTGKARIDRIFDQRVTEFELIANKMFIERIIEELGPESGFSGDVSFRLMGRCRFANLDQFADSLIMAGTAVIKNGKLFNFNVLKAVLDKISLIPHLYDNLLNNLPLVYKEQLKEADTPLDVVDWKLDVKEKKATLSGLNVTSNVFELQGQAAIDLKQQLDFEALVFIPRDLAAAMSTVVGELQALVDRDGRIKIPLRPYGGPASHFKVMPDLEYIGRRLIMYKGKQELRKVLDKGSEAETQAAEGEQPSSQEEKMPFERRLIEGIFDSLFKN